MKFKVMCLGKNLIEKMILSEDIRELGMEVYAWNPSTWSAGTKAQGS